MTGKNYGRLRLKGVTRFQIKIVGNIIFLKLPHKNS